jgi:hypothetical protein
MPNALIRNPADWRNGLPILQSELSALDAGLTAAVNGEGGGTYEQGAGDTTLDGAGLWLAASPDHTLTGLGTTALTPTDKAITHADNDYTLLGTGHPSRARTILTACARATAAAGFVTDTLSRNALQSTRVGAEMFVPLRVLDGARLAAVALSFYVTNPHEFAPALPVRCRILRVDAAGNATPMTTNDTGGFVPFTNMAFVGIGITFDANRLQTLTVACDTANVIDVAAYSYMAHVVEESGLNGLAGNIFADLALAFDTIANLRPQ